jgi:hypothetical protein
MCCRAAVVHRRAKSERLKKCWLKGVSRSELKKAAIEGWLRAIDPWTRLEEG